MSDWKPTADPVRDDLSTIDLPTRPEPLFLPWPCASGPGGFLTFHHPDQWRAFIQTLSLNPDIPSVLRAKYYRAQKLYLLGWIDADIIKAGELVALTALEFALRDRYGKQVKSKDRRSEPPFAELLKYMVQADGLTDAQIPMILRWGGTAIGSVDGTTPLGLAARRNLAAHGDPFDGFPIGGLLELVRDLIEYSYRDYLAEAKAHRHPQTN